MVWGMKQQTALAILKTGGNVFLTGEPGSGKTYVINQYIAWLRAAKIPVAVTASTGIAATHIGGTTIHSWSGIGIKDQLSQYDIDSIVSKEKIAKRIKNAKVLIIDEVSMLDGKVIDMLHQVTKAVRQSEQPFGGLQVVFVGDFFQLPPITRQGDVLRYAFESNAWQSAEILVCAITEQYRQDDELFKSLLNSIRKNEIEEEHYTLLQEQKEITLEHIEPTKLYTHNADVDSVNEKKLKELAGTTRTFAMSSRGAKLLVEGLSRNCLSPQSLLLKEEAVVMCTKNNFDTGYVNGTLGRVVRFDVTSGYPIIQTADGREVSIEPVSWEVAEDGKVLASIEQLPLRLAWAITVHKSQGMSLDAAEIDLSRAFVFGQGYVALSRVRSLAGLKVLGMHPNALSVDPKIIAQEVRFNKESVDAEDAFEAMDDTEMLSLHKNFVSAVGGTFPTGPVKEVTNEPMVPKESTTETTKKLLQKGKSVTSIAKERSLSTTTIWGHVEQLIAEESIEEVTIKSLISTVPNWNTTYQVLSRIMEEVGTEKLKPIYEAADEQYDYDIIRLARALYLSEKSAL